MHTFRPTMVALAVSLAFVVTAAGAGAPTDRLKQRVDEVITILSDPGMKDKPAERQKAVRQVAEQIFDFPETARRTLGPHWNQRSREEQREFTALFTDLLERTYVSKIATYQGEQVQFTGESIDGNDASVKTKITTKDGTEVPIEYRMRQRDGRWLVYDVIIEGVSLVANYRTQFHRIVTTESYPALVEKLKARDSTPAASPAKRTRRDQD